MISKEVEYVSNGHIIDLRTASQEDPWEGNKDMDVTL